MKPKKHLKLLVMLVLLMAPNSAHAQTVNLETSIKSVKGYALRTTRHFRLCDKSSTAIVGEIIVTGGAAQYKSPKRFKTPKGRY
jgi:hypothetical protein